MYNSSLSGKRRKSSPTKNKGKAFKEREQQDRVLKAGEGYCWYSEGGQAPGK
jgi:hypothetical protein